MGTLGDWVGTIPIALVCGALLTLPGWLALRLLGLRDFLALALAPTISTGILTFGATLIGRTPLRWGPVAIVLCTAAACALAYGLRRGLGRFGADPTDTIVIGHARREAHGQPEAWWVIPAALALAVISTLLAAIPALRRPSELPDWPDTSFHLNRIQLFHETGNASLTNPSFYPSAFHTVADSVLSIIPSTPIVAANVTSLVVAAVVWPLGMIALARETIDRSRLTTLAAGLACTVFTIFPSFIMGIGVLWPNALAYAALPSVLALGVRAWRKREPLTLVLLLGCVPILLTMHPNAVAGLGVIAVVAAATWLTQSILRGRIPAGRGWAILFGGVGLIVAALVILPRISKRVAAVAAYEGGGYTTFGQAFGEIIRGGMDNGNLLLLLGVAWILWRRRSLMPVVVVWLAIAALFVACAAGTSDWITLITGFWYNGAMRIAAMNAIPGTLLLVCAAKLVAELWRRTGMRSAGSPAANRIGVALGLTLIVLGTVGLNVADRRETLGHFYVEYDPLQRLVTDGQIADLTKLSAYVPAGEVVASRPENGSALMYALTGTKTLFTSIPGVATPDSTIIGRDLPQVATDPAVCAALKRTNVRWVLDSKEQYFWGNAGLTDGLVGLRNVPGLKLTAISGSYTLYRITACGFGG